MMDINAIFQYTPDLLNLLIDAIPRICRSKKDVLTFFKGAGVNSALMSDLTLQVKNDKDSISKYEITRTILTRLNERGDATLRERREILKRITELEDFSSCWPKDEWEARGFVAEIRRVINIKDSFTRINQEREAEREKRIIEEQSKREEIEQRRTKLATVRKDLSALFGETNHQKRGKQLESVLNSLFKVSGILVREAFTLNGSSGEGIVEQIDGAVEIDGDLYLVEMKWWNKPLGVNEVSPHLVRLFNRGQTGGIIISASDYTEPAIIQCKNALHLKIVVLCKLEEMVLLLEKEMELRPFLKLKINAAKMDRNPMYEPLRYTR
jgi:restriction system protein